MSPEELEYYRERAAVERRYAIESSNPHAVEIHLKLAELYEALLAVEQPPRPQVHMAGGTVATA